MAMTDARVLPSNLKIRLTGLVIVLVLAAAVLVTMVALAMAERDMKGVVGAQQFAVISSAAAFIDDRLEAKKQLIAELANRVPPAARADPRQLQAWLEAQAGLRSDFLNLTVFGADGRLMASLRAPPAGAPLTAAGKQYYEDTLARKRGIVSAPFRSGLSGAPIVLVTAPLLDDTGKVALVVAGAIELQRSAFLRQIDLLRPGKTGFVFIMTSAGILVDHPDKARLMQHIHQRPGINNATEMALSGYEGWIEAANKDGDDGIYSYKRLKAADWIVGARYPTAEAFAPMTNMRHRAVLAGAVAAVVAGLLAWLSIYRMLAPLESLRRSVSSIRRKHGGAPKEPRSDDIGELGSAFHELLAEREAAQQRTRGVERRARIVADNLPALIGYINSEQRYEFANAHYLDMLGADPRAMLGKTVRETIGERAYSQVEAKLAAALRGERMHFEQQLELRGREAHCMIDYIPDVADDGRVAGAYVLVTDISDRKNAELVQAASEKRLTLITDNLPVLISYIDGAHRFRFGNATFEKWFGTAPASLVGRPLADILGEGAYRSAKPYLDAAFGGGTVTFESRTTVGGKPRILETTYIPDLQGDGSVAGVYALTHDMTRMKEVEQELTQLTRVDSLTGIANRRMFVEALHLAIERARRGGGTMALAYLDIDHFKNVNDSHGHAVGDEALKEFARRLAANVRATDTVARLAGDEFVIIVEDLHNEQEVPAVAAKIADAIRVPFEVGGVQLAVTASIGIALFGGDGQTHAELLANADSALYAAKRAGRNQVVVHGNEGYRPIG
ncbi:MAG: diguanylate cyclase [Massilia sp.]|nr:diguanylate cyclase [Massilia sp.]